MNEKFEIRQRHGIRAKLIDILLDLGIQVLKVPRNSGPIKSFELDPQKQNGEIFRSKVALDSLIKNYDFNSVLDIGSGAGRHAQYLRDQGKDVTELDYGTSVYYKKNLENRRVIHGDYLAYEFEHQFDCIWASHVLEHQLNANIFLKKCYKDLREGGVLCVTVPPLRHEVVGGHVSLWNGGVLIYNLVLAGFDCRDASILYSDYNISAIIKKRQITNMPELSFDSGDIDLLKDYLPEGFHEGVNGFIRSLNWPN